MQTITLSYDTSTHVLSTEGGYAGTTIDNLSTVINVEGPTSDYDARLDCKVLVKDESDLNRYPHIDLTWDETNGCFTCTVPDTILQACKRNHRLPIQLVLTDPEEGTVTASRNIVVLDVAPAIDSFDSFTSAYADKWLKAIVSMVQDEDTGSLIATLMDGSTVTIPFDIQISGKILASQIEGIISLDNLPPSVKDEVITVETEADRLALSSSSVQNGDVVRVTQSNLLYIVVDDTLLGSEQAFQVFRAKVTWGDIDGLLTDQSDLATVLQRTTNVQADWNENDTTDDAYIANKPVLGTSAALDAGTQPGNVPVLNADGKISPSQMPDYALSQCKGVVQTKVELTGLSTAELGDWAFVTDDEDPGNNGMYILNGTYTEIRDWMHAETAAQVFSVDGRTGAVDLRSLDYVKVYRAGNDPYGTISGDGETTRFVIAHNLGTYPVVEIYDETGARTTTTVTSTTTTVTLAFSSAPTASESYKVVIHA